MRHILTSLAVPNPVERLVRRNVHNLTGFIMCHLKLSQVLAQRGIHVELWSPNFIPLLLGLVAQLAIVRLLLEVAAIIISGSSTAKGSSR